MNCGAMEERTNKIVRARLLISRLERLSADSYWAHQASGVRGALLRCIDQNYEDGNPIAESEKSRCQERVLDGLLLRGYSILEQAARELERRV
jgi:hypothetical protein